MRHLHVDSNKLAKLHFLMSLEISNRATQQNKRYRIKFALNLELDKFWLLSAISFLFKVLSSTIPFLGISIFSKNTAAVNVSTGRQINQCEIWESLTCTQLSKYFLDSNVKLLNADFLTQINLV